MIPEAAVEAAAWAMAEVEGGPDPLNKPNDIDFILARTALEASAPYIHPCPGPHLIPAPKDDSGW